MKIAKRGIILLLPLLTGIICAAWAGITQWKQTHFSCDSQLSMIGSEGQEEVILHFRFDGNTGLIESRGKYTPKKGDTIPTSNKIIFSFWRENNALVLISEESNQLPKVAPELFRHIPDFFSTRERGIRLQIVRKNPGGYIFLFENTPALYCAITR
ncbi:MAG: hypothetical protein ACRCWW_20780 [Scandinavium sp.]|uniref:hypothetical protein n=1 Tax=Scandinavium sp. TaxID=2830653 RepID=UPI003F3DB436